MRGTLLASPDLITSTTELPAQAAAPHRGGSPPPDLHAATTARAVAVAVLGRTLEVLDGRRPRSQLTGAVSDEVLAQIAVLLQRRDTVEQGCARLHRVHVQLRSGAAAEFFGTFVRGTRTRAFAGALATAQVRVSARGAPRRLTERWVVSEFAIL